MKEINLSAGRAPLHEASATEEPPGSEDLGTPDGTTDGAVVCGMGLALTLLGTESPHARLNGVRIPLTLRHAEILGLLALHPNGLTAEQLSLHLYGDDGNPVTIRAEIHRLRTQLGDSVAAKPYRLTGEVTADFLQVRSALAADDLAAVARVYLGPLLPRSESPVIRRERDELEAQVRLRLVLKGSPDDLWAYAQTEYGRGDIEVLERIVAMLPFDDHRHVAAHLRLTTPDPS